jgi:leader peptidase (prepilin peptidase)/N-methyltransferase
VRYPLVEGLVGSVFLLLFSVQLVSGGWNLANRTPNLYAGVVWVLLYTKWDLVGFYFYHLLLLSLLFVLLLVDYDRLRLNWRQVLGCSIWLGVPPLIWPSLYLWPLSLSLAPVASSGLQLGVGAVVGGVLGMAFDRRSHLAVGAAWVGMALGWQAVLGTLVVTCLLSWLGQSLAWVWQCLTRRRADFLWTSEAWTMWLLMGTMGHHVVWRLATMTLEPYWPGGTINVELVAIWSVTLAVLFGMTRAARWFWPAPATVPLVDSEATLASSSETP